MNGHGKQVMIVEDDEGIRDSLRELLEDEGYVVIAANNGRDALEALARRQPAVVLLDLMMPVMDGFEFLEALRGTELAARLPIYLLTAAGDLANTVEGVRGVLRKPIDIDRLLSVLAAA